MSLCLCVWGLVGVPREKASLKNTMGLPWQTAGRGHGQRGHWPARNTNYRASPQSWWIRKSRDYSLCKGRSVPKSWNYPGSLVKMRKPPNHPCGLPSHQTPLFSLSVRACFSSYLESHQNPASTPSLSAHPQGFKPPREQSLCSAFPFLEICYLWRQDYWTDGKQTNKQKTSLLWRETRLWSARGNQKCLMKFAKQTANPVQT